MQRKSSQSPIIIDLFAGAGGLSLGAARAGFFVACAVELDKRAIETHAYNFPNAKHFPIDISKSNGDEILNQAGLDKTPIAGVIGGPPCQGFSSIGHGRVDDDRNNLFLKFFQIVDEIHPAFFVAENVPGIMNRKYDEIRQTAFSCVSDYSILPPLIVKANEYGAPTKRTRVFFIGYDKRIITSLSQAEFEHNKVKADEMIKVGFALRGLPKNIMQGILMGGKNTIDPDYFGDPEIIESPFHSRVIGEIPLYVGNQESVNNYHQRGIITGCMPTKHSEEVKRRYQELKYGKQDAISKSQRLDPNGYCPTLRAGTGPERGSYQAVRPIHYEYSRVITPREAARLQGFPDWFVFHSTIWHSFRQIGNSVSPIVAEKILSVLLHKLT